MQEKLEKILTQCATPLLHKLDRMRHICVFFLVFLAAFGNVSRQIGEDRVYCEHPKNKNISSKAALHCCYLRVSYEHFSLRL